MSSVIPIVTRIGETETRNWLEALQGAMPGHKVLTLDQLSKDQRNTCKVAIVANPDPAELAGLPNLKWVQSLWAGVEQLVPALTETSIEIVRMRDPQLAATMAEAVLAWALYLHRDMPCYRQQQDDKRWCQHNVPLASERTIGVLGLGSLGKATARKLVEQGFCVCGWSRTKVELENVETFAGADMLEIVLNRSDILVVLLPLTDETRNLLDLKTLNQLPKHASVINFARSSIIDDNALLTCLNSGHLDHGILDVFDTEPLPQSSPYWDHPSITVLPHIAAPTNKKTASAIVAENIERFFEMDRIPEGVSRTRGY